MKSKVIASLMLSLFIVCLVSTAFITSIRAQNASGPSTVALWHLDDIKPSGDYQATSDSAGHNDGLLGGDPSPVLVPGQFDKAINFNGHNAMYVPISFWVGFPPSSQPIYIPISPSLNIQKEIKIDAWINVQEFTNATYNNILVKCTRTDASWQNTTRIVGLAIRGAGTPEDGIAVPQGTLSGFLLTDASVFNEVVTAQPLITLNHWTHVTFTRTVTGMHLYVNGHEETVKAIHGVQNPTGSIMNGTEIWLGHDSKVTLDEVSISDLAPLTQTTLDSIDIGPNLLVAAVVVSVIFATAWILRRAIQMIVFRSKP